MNSKLILKENWLTQRPPYRGDILTWTMVGLLLFMTFIYLGEFFHADKWMSASGFLVFKKHEYYRAWTTLFAHGDMGHVLSNLLLFFPFAYYLSSYFGFFFFPLVGFFMGGITNLIVLSRMPEQVGLVGVSGVVHWMGAAWMTLSCLIDLRLSAGKRLLRAVGVSIMLFIPDTYKPEVSYSSHFIGFILGIVSALIFYFCYHKKFHEAEVWEEVFGPEIDFDWGEEKEVS